MKNIFILLAFIIIGSFSCTKSNTNSNSTGNNTSSANTFFKISFDGINLQTNGLTSNDNAINSMYKALCRATVTSIPSMNKSDLQINVMGSSLNSQSNNNTQTVDAILHFVKQGGEIGKYNLPDEPNAIYDIRTSRITYLVDNNSGSINISKIDGNYIYGTFSINLKSNRGLIPATGSFKLNKF